MIYEQIIPAGSVNSIKWLIKKTWLSEFYIVHYSNSALFLTQCYGMASESVRYSAWINYVLFVLFIVLCIVLLFLFYLLFYPLSYLFTVLLIDLFIVVFFELDSLVPLHFHFTLFHHFISKTLSRIFFKKSSPFVLHKRKKFLQIWGLILASKLHFRFFFFFLWTISLSFKITAFAVSSD